jgi:hypothetical protein
MEPAHRQGGGEGRVRIEGEHVVRFGIYLRARHFYLARGTPCASIYGLGTCYLARGTLCASIYGIGTCYFWLACEVCEAVVLLVVEYIVRYREAGGFSLSSVHVKDRGIRHLHYCRFAGVYRQRLRESTHILLSVHVKYHGIRRAFYCRFWFMTYIQHGPHHSVAPPKRLR